jgi:hypothetical protein
LESLDRRPGIREQPGSKPEKLNTEPNVFRFAAESGHCLVGVAAATQRDVLIAGVAGLVAGAISMAAGESYHGRSGDKILPTLAEPGTGQYCSVFEQNESWVG